MMIKLKEMVGFHKNTNIKNVLLDVLHCKKHGLQYSPKLKFAATSNQSTIQDLTGVEAQIVADCVEDGHSIN